MAARDSKETTAAQIRAYEQQLKNVEHDISVLREAIDEDVYTAFDRRAHSEPKAMLKDAKRRALNYRTMIAYLKTTL